MSNRTSLKQQLRYYRRRYISHTPRETLCMDALAHSSPWDLRKYVFSPHCARSGRMRSRSWWLRLTGPPDLVLGPDAPHNSLSLVDSSEEGPAFSGTGHPVAPASRSLEPSCVASGQDTADLSGLLPAMVDTITQARPPEDPINAFSALCFLSSKRSWSEGCVPPPCKCMLLLLRYITMH